MLLDRFPVRVGYIVVDDRAIVRETNDVGVAFIFKTDRVVHHYLAEV